MWLGICIPKIENFLSLPIEDFHLRNLMWFFSWASIRQYNASIKKQVLIILNVFTLVLTGVLGIRDYQPPNLRGRCAFGAPCDENFISYGCERFNDNVGLCWSECTGNLPKNTGEGGFVYQGWCYNMNSALVTDIFSGKSGKSGKS